MWLRTAPSAMQRTIKPGLLVENGEKSNGEYGTKNVHSLPGDHNEVDQRSIHEDRVLRIVQRNGDIQPGRPGYRRRHGCLDQIVWDNVPGMQLRLL
jgi:hypothetical protein